MPWLTPEQFDEARRITRSGVPPLVAIRHARKLKPAEVIYPLPPAKGVRLPTPGEKWSTWNPGPPYGEPSDGPKQ